MKIDLTQDEVVALMKATGKKKESMSDTERTEFARAYVKLMNVIPVGRLDEVG